MLWTIVVIILILWLLGFIGHVGGGLIHLLLVIAVIVMLIFVNPISSFVDRHPTIKMLALSFLILIGVVLVAEGVHHHIPRGYIYFSMAFSVLVEMLNIRIRKVSKPVELHQPYRK